MSFANPCKELRMCGIMRHLPEKNALVQMTYHKQMFVESKPGVDKSKPIKSNKVKCEYFTSPQLKGTYAKCTMSQHHLPDKTNVLVRVLSYGDIYSKNPVCVVEVLGRF
jgi:hypothetical protein